MCDFFCIFIAQFKQVMLTPQQSLPFCNYSGLYDIIVPKDHLLRQINDLIDFSFVYEELISKYTRKKNQQNNQTLTYYFDIEKCKTCTLRNNCYKEGAKSKTYSITIKTDTQKEQLAFQETAEFKDIYRNERYKIEAKNAELKNVFGYDKAESYGIEAMQMQGVITMVTANIKRIIKLIAMKEK